MQRLPSDFQTRYDILSLLYETVSGLAYAGTSLAASGWLHVGKISGRGRYFLLGQKTERKGIWMRPLCSDWHLQFGVRVSDFVPPPRPKRVATPSEGLAMTVWAANELGVVPSNKAFVERLVKSVRTQAMVPSKTFFSAASGDEAAVVGYYRLIERPDTATFSPEAILTAHRERRLCRIRGAKTALLIQDGSDLNFAIPRASTKHRLSI